MANIVISNQTYEGIKEVQLPTENGFAHFVFAYASATDDTDLPDGYTRLTTVRASAGSWFQTDTMLTADDIIQVTFRYTTYGGNTNGTIFTDNSASGYGLKFYGTSGGTISGYCGGQNFSGSTGGLLSNLITLLVYADSSVMYADGTKLFSPVKNGNKTSGNNFKIGEGNTTGSMVGELGAFKVIRNGDVYREYLPCKDSSDNVGFYETKTGTFYQSSGTAYA